LAEIEKVEGSTGFALDAARRAAMGTWLDEILVWNAKIDLTAAKTKDELVELMVTDALVLAREIAGQGARVIDVGTGAGAPGLGLAIARPDLKLTLVDPLQKRIAFLRTTLGRLRRADVTLVAGHGDKMVAEPPAFDVAISRATLAPVDWLALGRRLVGAAGEVWVLLGESEAGADALPPGERHEYAWPHTGRRRSALRFARG
jgi:16S rRNA (guanine527-N7)-methyltransferase